MKLLLILALLIGLPSSAHEHKWDNQSKDTQCSAINKELHRAVKHGTLTHREAKAIGKRCYSRKG